MSFWQYFWQLCNILIYPPLTHLPLVTWGLHTAAQNLAITRIEQLGDTATKCNSWRLNECKQTGMTLGEKMPCSWMDWCMRAKQTSCSCGKVAMLVDRRHLQSEKILISFTSLRLLRSMHAWRESRNEPNLLMKFRLWLVFTKGKNKLPRHLKNADWKGLPRGKIDWLIVPCILHLQK